MIHSRTVIKENEVYSRRINNGFIVMIEVFKTANEYTVFASSKLPEHEDLVGMARNENKDASIKLAIKDLSRLIEG